MRSYIILTTLLGLTLLTACTMGKKNWPRAEESEDAFELQVLSAERTDNCLMLQLDVSGAVDRLYRASIQYEEVGGESGGCIDCPFVPRDARHLTRNNQDFILDGNTLSLSMCSFEPGQEYRFRVAGKSELPGTPLVFTKVYVAEP